MNKYEGVFILKSDMEEETRKKVFEKIVSTITEDGKVENVDEWGNRKLAYEINYIKEGYYYVVSFETKTFVPAHVFPWLCHGVSPPSVAGLSFSRYAGRFPRRSGLPERFGAALSYPPCVQAGGLPVACLSGYPQSS